MDSIKQADAYFSQLLLLECSSADIIFVTAVDSCTTPDQP